MQKENKCFQMNGSTKMKILQPSFLLSSTRRISSVHLEDVFSFLSFIHLPAAYRRPKGAESNSTALHSGQFSTF